MPVCGSKVKKLIDIPNPYFGLKNCPKHHECNCQQHSINNILWIPILTIHWQRSQLNLLLHIYQKYICWKVEQLKLQFTHGDKLPRWPQMVFLSNTLAWPTPLLKPSGNGMFFDVKIKRHRPLLYEPILLVSQEFTYQAASAHIRILMQRS